MYLVTWFIVSTYEKKFFIEKADYYVTEQNNVRWWFLSYFISIKKISH